MVDAWPTPAVTAASFNCKFSISLPIPVGDQGIVIRNLRFPAMVTEVIEMHIILDAIICSASGTSLDQGSRLTADAHAACMHSM